MGCGRVARQADLVRYALEGGRVVADPERRRPGRGAYLCPQHTCLERATARRAFPRAFRAAVASVDIPAN